MASVTVEFDSYRTWYYSSYVYEGIIYCYQGSTQVGTIVFLKANATDNDLKCTIVNGKPSVRYRIDRFSDVYQLLLHEAPLELFANDAGVGAVGPGLKEPIGEEE
jgi:hypothetical protein